MKRTRVRCRRAVAATLLAAAAWVAPRAGAAARTVSQRTYVVKPGDTVWSIAERIGGPSNDPRPLVDALIRVNHLRDALVRPGQRLSFGP